jgi:hypothetical protein
MGIPKEVGDVPRIRRLFVRVMRIAPFLFAYLWVTEMFPQNEIRAGVSASTFLDPNH